MTSDAVSRGNPGTITAEIFESNCTFNGAISTWKFDFQDPSLDQLFAIETGSATSSQVNLQIFLCNGAAGSCSTISTCSYDVEATLVTPTEMSGTYTAGENCASFNQGSFDIALRNRFTPTAVPTQLVEPTTTPEPTSTPSP